MSQISPPIRILLVAVIGLPRRLLPLPASRRTRRCPPPPRRRPRRPDPRQGPERPAAEQAGRHRPEGAADTQNASDRAEQAAGTSQGIDDGKTDGTTSVGPASSGVNTNPVTKAPATGQTAAPAPITATRSRRCRRTCARRSSSARSSCCCFWNNRSADDRAVAPRAQARRATYGKQRLRGRARRSRTSPATRPITRGVDVEQSPTIVVVDANLKAETLVGYVDRDTINQAVVDALRASGGSLITNRVPTAGSTPSATSGNAAGQGAAAAVRGSRHPRATSSACQGVTVDMETQGPRGSSRAREVPRASTPPCHSATSVTASASLNWARRRHVEDAGRRLAVSDRARRAGKRAGQRSSTQGPRRATA